jgi:hypothetical protein
LIPGAGSPPCLPPHQKVTALLRLIISWIGAPVVLDCDGALFCFCSPVPVLAQGSSDPAWQSHTAKRLRRRREEQVGGPGKLLGARIASLLPVSQWSFLKSR